MKKQNKDSFLNNFIPYLKSQGLDLYHLDGSPLNKGEYFNMIKLFIHGMIASCAESNSCLGLNEVCTASFVENTRSIDHELKFKMKIAPSLQNYLREHQELIDGNALIKKDFNDIMYELSNRTNLIVFSSDDNIMEVL